VFECVFIIAGIVKGGTFRLSYRRPLFNRSSCLKFLGFGY
jgi:hypothetical protein